MDRNLLISLTCFAIAALFFLTLIHDRYMRGQVDIAAANAGLKQVVVKGEGLKPDRVIWQTK